MHKLRHKIGSFFSAMGDCLTLSWRTSPAYTVLRLLCNVIPPLLTLLASLLGKYVLDLLAGTYGGGREYALLLLFSGCLCLIAIVRSLLQKAQTYMQLMHNELINKELALYMMERAGTMDLEFFDNADYYDKLNACVRDAPMIGNLLWNTLSAVSASVTVLISFTVLGRANIFFSLLTILAAVPASIASAKYTKSIYSLSLEQINGERKKGYLQGLLMSRQAAQDMRLFNVCGIIKDKYRRIWEELFHKKRALTRTRSVLTGVLECLPEIAVAVIGVGIALGVLAGEATIGDYSLYTGLVTQLWAGVYLLSNAVMQIYDNQLKIANVKTLEQYRNHIADDGTRALERVDTISFEHVSFTYPGTQKQVLTDVTFQVGKQEKVVLVGLNGSGKSTLIKLLLRLYDVSEGAIKVNGVDIREYRLQDLRRSFSVYFQDAPSFSFDLRENITISDPEREAGDREVLQALDSSGAGDILERAPRGLDTYVTRMFDNAGMELSGGQYQKLALARTMYRRHSALVLDEPSSNLDPRAEHLLFEQLRALTEGKTVLFTSHRLSNVFLADRIVVLEMGRVIETGTDEQLLAAGGRYAELRRYQQEHLGSQEKGGST